MTFIIANIKGDKTFFQRLTLSFLFISCSFRKLVCFRAVNLDFFILPINALVVYYVSLFSFKIELSLCVMSVKDRTTLFNLLTVSL